MLKSILKYETFIYKKCFWVIFISYFDHIYKSLPAHLTL